ncbi:unnamed protein product [Rotaria magnacalcarata]|uniref:Uncharacterized protein n=1 Tax=Rotaria magnacalcarata TaxID=392030 RepID=A0A816YPQ4_9BILA|nr:unnamed protein product [Rotaria magnacalcarata]
MSISFGNLTVLESKSIMYFAKLKVINFKNLNSPISFNSTPDNRLEFVSFENTPSLTDVNLGRSSHLETVMFIDAPRMKPLDLSSCRLISFPVSILTLTSLEILNNMQNN